MSGKSAAVFDHIAPSYDADFTHSLIGKWQRERVWHFLEKDLDRKKSLHILEINCGTGEDALWLVKKKHKVYATDASSEMIAQAEFKAKKSVLLNEKEKPELSFSVCAFEQLTDKLSDQRFDLIFSNFGGLNCANEETLTHLNRIFSGLLQPNGKLIMVLLGKKCLTEKLFFTLKGDGVKANRRLQPASVQLAQQVFQPAWYYHSNEIKKLFSSFTLQNKKPVGLFIPPSYLEPWIQKRKFLLPVLNIFEQTLGNLSALADYGDHIYLSLTKIRNAN